MQTIILTDNKRLAAGYCAEKTMLFADTIDVNRLLNTQVYEMHITKAKFWFIRDNVYNEELLVYQFCKNLLSKKRNQNIFFTFSVTKIESIRNSQLVQEANNVNNETYNGENTWERSRINIATPYKSNNSHVQSRLKVKKSNSYSKSLNSTQWSFQKSASCLFNNTNPIHDSQPQPKSSPSTKLKQIFKKDFQISSLNELKGIFLSRLEIFQEQGMDGDLFLTNNQMIANYTFRLNEIEISLGVIGKGSRVYLQKAIEVEISQAINQRFNGRKLIYESKDQFTPTVVQKSLQKLTDQKQTYHKIILFLFSHNNDPQTDKLRPHITSLTHISHKQPTHNKYIQAIQQWRIKDNDVNITQKLSKQYALIKQQIESEKNNFRSKLKMFEAIIGERVNVDKLLNQEKETETHSNVMMNSLLNGQFNSMLSIPIDANLRQPRQSKRKSNLNSAVNSTNSEFKRLKESFQIIRNIDNIINQQTKKIQTLHKHLKQITKQKHQAIFNHAKSLNAVKKQILSIKQQIQLKERQYQYKNEKIQENNQIKINTETSPEVQHVLDKNMRLFQKIMSNSKGLKLYEESLLNQSSCISNSYNKENFSQQKKLFMIRKQYKTLQQSSNFQKAQGKNIQNDQTQDYEEMSQFSQTYQYPKIFKSIQRSQISMEQQMLKRRKQQIQQQNLYRKHISQKQQNAVKTESNDHSNNKEKDFLLSLYQHFITNQKLINEISNEISSFQRINNDRMEISLKSSSSTRNSSGYQFKRSSKNSIDSLGLSRGSSMSQLNLHKVTSTKSSLSKSSMFSNNNKNSISSSGEFRIEKFPLLNQLLNPKQPVSTVVEDDQYSIISIHRSLEEEHKKAEQPKQMRPSTQHVRKSAKKMTIQQHMLMMN